MTNKDKAKELADFLYFKLSHIDYGTLTEKFLEMAKWKDEQFENKLRELLYKNFYIHPHDEGLICSEAFDCKDDFDIFVEDFVKELDSIQL